MDGIVEFAGMLKDRENKPYMGPQVGVVVSPPPDLKVSLGPTILLDKDHLILSAHVLADYQRAIRIQDAGGFTGSTESALDGTAYEHTHGYSSLGFTAQAVYTDTLQAGDEVILVPSTDIQTYFLIDKVVRL